MIRLLRSLGYLIGTTESSAQPSTRVVIFDPVLTAFPDKCLAEPTRTTSSVTGITYICAAPGHLRADRPDGKAVVTKATELLVDDACTDFVHWLTSMTLEGRARWELQPDGLISYLPTSAFAQFITDRSRVGQSWRLFSVHDSNGELCRATPPTFGVDTSPLAAAVEALFLTIHLGRRGTSFTGQ